jgi:SAM-dependent methyltransferase
MHSNPENLDRATVSDFGHEWQRFDQGGIPHEERMRLFDEYFAVFPWQSLPPAAAGFDAGCGSGRWAALVAPRVGRLHCVDASADALRVAQKNLSGIGNVSFHEAPLDAMPFVKKLKPGAPMLVYFYYAFDNRPAWFRLLWRASDVLRRALSQAPFRLKAGIAELLAAFVYWPLARGSRLFERLGCDVTKWPLSAYRRRSYYNMRTDALDRFGTRLEHRMTQAQIKAVMEKAGLGNIRFSDAVPFWCAVGCKL